MADPAVSADADSDRHQPTFPRDVYLEGGPLDGRIWTVDHPYYEMHFGGTSVAYRVTDEPDIWQYVRPGVGSPMREDGRLTARCASTAPSPFLSACRRRFRVAVVQSVRRIWKR